MDVGRLAAVEQWFVVADGGGSLRHLHHHRKWGVARVRRLPRIRPDGDHRPLCGIGRRSVRSSQGAHHRGHRSGVDHLRAVVRVGPRCSQCRVLPRHPHAGSLRRRIHRGGMAVIRDRTRSARTPAQRRHIELGTVQCGARLRPGARWSRAGHARGELVLLHQCRVIPRHGRWTPRRLGAAARPISCPRSTPADRGDARCHALCPQRPRHHHVPHRGLLVGHARRTSVQPPRGLRHRRLRDR